MKNIFRQVFGISSFFCFASNIPLFCFLKKFCFLVSCGKIYFVEGMFDFLWHLLAASRCASQKFILLGCTFQSRKHCLLWDRKYNWTVGCLILQKMFKAVEKKSKFFKFVVLVRCKFYLIVFSKSSEKSITYLVSMLFVQYDMWNFFETFLLMVSNWFFNYSKFFRTSWKTWRTLNSIK